MDLKYFEIVILKCQYLIFGMYYTVICIDVFNTQYWCKICSSDVLYLLYSIYNLQNWN